MLVRCSACSVVSDGNGSRPSEPKKDFTMTKFTKFAAATLIALAAAAPALADGEGYGVAGTPANIQVGSGQVSATYNADRGVPAPRYTPALGFTGPASSQAASFSFNSNQNG
jgi:hypothetical protein